MLSERGAQTYALLRTCLQWIPGPRSAHVSGPPGFSTRQRFESCPDCLANGRVLHTCETCGGRGEVPAGSVDPYSDPPRHVPPDPRRIASGFGGAARELARDRARALELELDRLRDEQAVRAGKQAPLSRELRLIAARDRLYAAGSYAQLARALERLRDLDVRAYRYCRAIALASPAIANDVDVAAVEALAALMPTTIRVPAGIPLRTADQLAQLARDARDALWRGRNTWAAATRAQRDTLIVQALDSGERTAAIARRYAISRRRVQQVARARREQDVPGDDAPPTPRGSVSGVSHSAARVESRHRL